MVFLDFFSTVTRKTYFCELSAKVNSKNVGDSLTEIAKKYIPAFLSVYGRTDILANTDKFTVYYAKSGKIYNDVTVTLGAEGKYEITQKEWLTHPSTFTWNFDSKRFEESELAV